jgi:hypothetical protein
MLNIEFDEKGKICFIGGSYKVRAKRNGLIEGSLCKS